MSDSPTSPSRDRPSDDEPDTFDHPGFEPARLRRRFDGWTTERQEAFILAFAKTACVAAACRAVGMSERSAHTLRARRGAESFAAAWDAALGMPLPKVTPPAQEFLDCDPLVRLVMFRGRYRGSWVRRDNSALLQLVRRLDRTAGQGHTV